MSGYVLDECSDGDASAAKRRLDLLEKITVLETGADVKALAEVYLRLLSIPQKSRTDAFHLAICCVRSVNILLSWNCRHLGAESMQAVQRYNDANGLSTPQMVTPASLVRENTEVDFNE